MEREQVDLHGHESVDHEDPASAGLMDDSGEEVPGTGIMGDETLVRAIEGEEEPGIALDSPGRSGGEARPGPTPVP